MDDTPLDPDRAERRLIELEVKASFTEDTLDRLNEVVVRQQRQIDMLQRELVRLLQQRAPSEEPSPRGVRDDLPPHY